MSHFCANCGGASYGETCSTYCRDALEVRRAGDRAVRKGPSPLSFPDYEVGEVGAAMFSDRFVDVEHMPREVQSRELTSDDLRAIALADFAPVNPYLIAIGVALVVVGLIATGYFFPLS